jgi:hypothetical protein
MSIGDIFLLNSGAVALVAVVLIIFMKQKPKVVV